MASDDKWYFSKEQLANTPSHKYGFDADKELSCRQQAANFIQDMGQRLQVTQLCINTAIVYMHRYYVFHSFSHFHRNDMAIASLFLAAKVEEQPRKLEHVIKVAQVCLHKEHPLDTRSEQYQVKSQDLIVNENLLLQTLGFDVAIDHPHTHVVKCCHLVRATKELAQTSYFMASNSLHLTTMCLQYKPTVVACFCIHLACKWTNWEIPPSMEGKLWFWYVDRSVTQELLEYLTDEFLCIFDKCSSRLKRKITALSDSQNMALLSGYSYPGMDNAARKQDEQPSNVPSFHAQPVTIVQNLAIQSRGPDGVIKHPSASRIEENKKRITETLVLPFTYKPLPTNTQPQSSSYHNNGSHSAILEANINSASSLSSSSQILNSPPMVHDSFKHNSSNVQPEYTLPHSNRNTHNSGSHPIIQHESVPSFQQSHYKGNHNLSLNGASHLHKNSASGRPTETKIFTPNHHQKTQIKVHNISKSSASGVNSRSARGCHQISNRNSTSGGKSIENNLIKSPACEESLHKIKSPAPLPKPPSTHFTIPQPKPASIFSPEKVTPSLYSPPRDKQTLSVVLNSPVASGKIGHNRTSSSSSEAELIPVMQKLENISGFGSIAKGKTAVKLSDRVPDLIQSIRNVEVKPTTENSVSAVPKASNVKSFSLPQIEGVLSSNQDYRNFKGHKKKTKHKEHKDQDKEKDKKQKQKDKHYEKHRDPKDPAPIKITIPKDKINHIFPLKPEPSLPLQNSGDVLKIKIPKEKLLQTPPTGLKIKISNDLKVNNGIKHTITSVATPPPPSPAMTRKRDHTLDRQELQRPPTKSPRGQMKPNAHYRMGSEVNYSRPHMSWYRPRFHQRFPPRMHHLPHFQLHQPMLMFTQHPPPYLIPVYSHYPNPNYIPAHYTHHPPPPPLPIGPPPVTPPPPPLPPPE